MVRPTYGAVLLAAGKGSRMNTETPKQYLPVNGRPILYYSLAVLEASDVDQIVLVVGDGEEEWVREEVVERFGFRKVSAIVQGGKERSHSVHNGLGALRGVDYVLIHDGARPCIDVPMVKRVMEAVEDCKACVVGMPMKDTVKIVDGDNTVVDTPNRDRVWGVQTPQAFDYLMIKGAYEAYMERGGQPVTDDAMVLEHMTDCRVKVIEGSYRNVKVTTPEDLKLVEEFLQGR